MSGDIKKYKIGLSLGSIIALRDVMVDTLKEEKLKPSWRKDYEECIPRMDRLIEKYSGEK